MYRATKLDQLEMLIPPRCPLGPIFANMNVDLKFEIHIDPALIEWKKASLWSYLVKDGSGANIKVYPLVGGNKEPAMLNLK